MLAALRDAVGEEQLANLMDEGRTWNEDQAVTEARCSGRTVASVPHRDETNLSR